MYLQTMVCIFANSTFALKQQTSLFSISKFLPVWNAVMAETFHHIVALQFLTILQVCPTGAEQEVAIV